MPRFCTFLLFSIGISFGMQAQGDAPDTATIQLQDSCSQEVRRSMTGMGNNYYGRAMFDSAMYCYHRTLNWVLQCPCCGPTSNEAASALMNIGVVYRDQGRYIQSRTYLQQALTILVQLPSPNKVTLKQVYYNFGTLYRAMSQPDTALIYLKQAREVAIQTKDTLRELNNLMSMAYCFSMKNQPQEALRLYEDALRRRILFYNNNPEEPKLAQYYGDFGTLLSLSGDIDRGQAYLEISINMLRKQAPGLALPITLQQAANSLMRTNPYNQSARTWLQESIEILEKSNRPEKLAYSYENLGMLEYGIEQYGAAIKNLQKAMDIRATLGDSVSIVAARTLRLLGESQIMTGEPALAIPVLRQAVGILERLGNLEQSEYIIALAQLAHAYTNLHQLDQAQAALTLAARHLNVNLSQPDFSRIDDTNGTAAFFDSYMELLLQQIEHGERKLLPLAKQISQSYLQLLAFEGRDLAGEESLLYHRRQLHGVFGQAVRVALLEGNVPAAFYYSERSKAQALLGDYSIRTTSVSSQPFDIQVDSIRRLKTNITLLEQQHQQELPLAEKDKLAARLLQARNDLAAQQLDFYQHHPEYWSPAAGQPDTDLSSLRRAILPPETALIEFYYADGALTTFLLTKDTLLTWQNLHAVQLPTITEGYLASISTASMLPAALDTCNSRGYALYQLLLAKPLATLSPAIKHLIIVPDGLLARVPFTALPTQLPSPGLPGQWPFLVKKYAISYAFSGGLLAAQLAQPASTAPESFGGFAAQYGPTELSQRLQPADQRGDGKGDDLKYARQEVQKLAVLCKGTAWLANEATEVRFRALSAHYRVLHLAMHAVENMFYPDFSTLLFTAPGRDTTPEADGDFYVGDLSALSLHADLVTLSACQSSIGRIAPGESTLSLAYAFTRAGTPAVTASLWSVKDKPTMDLMVTFYERMQTGLPKDEALRQAQLAFIGQAEDLPELAHPFYWAAFGVIGSTRPIIFKK